MTASIERNVYVLRREIPNPIHYVRGTNAISLIFHFRDIEIPSGATAQVYVKKPSGKEAYNTAVISGNDVTVDVTIQMFIEAGKNILQVQINQGEENLVTFEQPVIVHENYTEGDAEQSENESTLLQQYVDEVAQAAEDAKNQVQNEVANGKNDLDDYVEALKETIPADYTELSESVEQLERNKAPAIIEEASGTEITLDDSGSALVKDLQLYGYSKQTQTTGAQLFDAGNAKWRENLESASDINRTDTGVEFTASEKLSAAGVYTSTTAMATGTYFYSADITVSDKNFSTLRIGFSDENTSTTIQSSSITANKTFHVSGTATSIIHSAFVVYINNASKVAGTHVKVENIMIAESATEVPWEPYSGGVASPSPDWPQPIHSVADEMNLLNFPDVESIMVDGVTWSCKDGVVSATGNATGMANTLYTDLSYIFPIKAGTYKISGANDKILIIARITKSDDSLEYLEPGFTLDGTEKEVRIYVRAANTGAISSTIYPMLNVGTTDLPWRPYGHNVTVRSAGAQLYDAAQMNGQTSAGVTALVADVGEIILNGTATANAFLNSPVEYPFSGHIYASMNNDAANDNVMFRFVDESDAIIDNFVINTANKTAEYNFSKEVHGITIRIAENTMLTNFRLRPMLNRGSTQLPWQPYVTPSSALIALTDSLRGIPVDNGGNYTDESGQQWIADYIYRRQTDGKWMLWRNCGSVVYDGSEDEGWRLDSNFTRYYSINKTGFQESTTARRRSMNSLFRLGASGETTGGNNVYTITDTLSIYIALTHTETIEDLTALLAQKPMTLVGILATPTIEELPADVQAELNGLYTYSLHTDMWNSDNAYMALQYAADTKSYIDKKISEISDAIIERLN